MGPVAMSPLAIRILLHCYYSPRPWPHECAESKRIIEDLVDEGLLVLDHEGGRIFNSTGRGDAHVRQLCALPFPERAWIDAHGELIKDV